MAGADNHLVKIRDNLYQQNRWGEFQIVPPTKPKNYYHPLAFCRNQQGVFQGNNPQQQSQEINND